MCIEPFVSTVYFQLLSLDVAFAADSMSAAVPVNSCEHRACTYRFPDLQVAQEAGRAKGTPNRAQDVCDPAAKLARLGFNLELGCGILYE